MTDPTDGGASRAARLHPEFAAGTPDKPSVSMGSDIVDPLEGTRFTDPFQPPATGPSPMEKAIAQADSTEQEPWAEAIQQDPTLLQALDKAEIALNSMEPATRRSLRGIGALTNPALVRALAAGIK